MRILHAFAPAPVGGLERVVAELAAGHRARGHEVHVVASVSPPLDPALVRFLAELRRRCLVVHRLDVPARAYLRERTLGVGLLRRLRPDLVHTHGLRCDVVFGGAARALGIPTVTTVHGYTGGGAWMRGMETVQRAALRRFDAVVAVSGPLAARLASAGVPRARIRVIPNAWRAAAPPLLTRQEARERLGLDGPHVQLGWVGRLSREKGLDVFIDALGELRDLLVVASIVGDGPDAARLRARAGRRGVAGRVRWHGTVEGVAALFPAFDAFVLSSRTEGTPMVLLEAMAAGVPIVASRVGGVPDVVSGDEALLVPAGDSGALARAIRHVIAGPGPAEARAASARERLKSAFSAGPWLERYETLYRNLAPAP